MSTSSYKNKWKNNEWEMEMLNWQANDVIVEKAMFKRLTYTLFPYTCIHCILRLCKYMLYVLLRAVFFSPSYITGKRCSFRIFVCLNIYGWVGMWVCGCVGVCMCMHLIVNATVSIFMSYTSLKCCSKIKTLIACVFYYILLHVQVLMQNKKWGCLKNLGTLFFFFFLFSLSISFTNCKS